MTLQLLSKQPRWVIGLAAVATVITGSSVFYALSQIQAPPPASTPAPVPRKIGALGRLEPDAEVIKLSAPVALDGDRVAQLLVKQGDRVQAGQVVAILDSRDQLADALREAEVQVQMAKAKLAQVQAGAKTGEIAAQRATIARLKAELAGTRTSQAAAVARWQSEARTAQAEFNRYQQLYRQGAVAASTLDTKRLDLETARAQLTQAEAEQNQSNQSLLAQIQQAEATLNQIAEVRPTDLRTAQTEVEQALAAAAKAKTDLAQAYVRAPIAARILKVHARPGEKLSDAGIVELAQTNQMVAVAEVYQSDIGKVQVGQAASIISPAFSGELRGTVSEIGLQVSRQKVFSNEPGENLDQRVVEVKIRLNPTDSQKVAGLTNLQVQTAILLDRLPSAPTASQACVDLPLTNTWFSLNPIC